MRIFLALFSAFGLASAAICHAQEPKAGPTVMLDLLVADLSAAALGEGEVTAAKLLDLSQQGKLDSAARIRLSVLENHPASVQFSEQVPVESGRSFGPGGQGGSRSVPSYSMQNHGTMVQVTARVEQDDAIVLEIQAERSRLVANRPAGEEGGAASIAASKTTQARVQTTTRAKSGTPVIVGSQQTGSGKDAIHTYFVLTASVPEGGKAAAAAGEEGIKVLALANARASEVGKVLKEVLTSVRFRISADERTNSLIISGPPEVLDIIRNLALRLDEARAATSP